MNKKAVNPKGKGPEHKGEAKERGPASKPFSLAPLTFEDAIGGLLETDAEAVRELERKASEKREAKKK